MNRKMVCLILAILFATTTVVLAKQPVPNSGDAGRLEKRFKEPRGPKSTLRDGIKIPDLKGQTLPKEAEKKIFKLAHVAVEGATVYAVADFAQFYKKYLSEMVSLADIYKIAKAITVKYRNAGYILTRAFVPVQTIQGGTVKISVLEGFVDKVVFEGNARIRQNLLKACTNKIVASRPLRSQDLERYLLLIDDLPGVSVKSVLKPSADQVGATTLTLVLSYQMVAGNISFDNRGTESVGPYQGLVGLNLNSIFGFSEATTVRFATASEFEELGYYQLGYVGILGSEGMSLNFTATQSQSELGDMPLDIDVESESRSFSAQLSYPIIRSRRKNLSAYLGFTHRNSKTDLLGEKLSEDRLRIVQAGLNFDLADRFRGVNFLNLEVSQGLNILNETRTGSDYLTRTDGHSDFTKLVVNLSRTQQLSQRLTALVSGAGQWAGHKLLSSEEFGIGGTSFGKAFDSSEITGDRGFAGLLELKYSSKFLKPFASIDYGQVHQIGTGQDELASFGGGVRFGGKYFSGSVEIAKPLTHIVAAEGDQDARFFFSVKGGF